MENSSKSEVELIAQEITRYLGKHQFAADTIDGICHWWITQQRIEEEQKKVLSAINYLLENKLIGMRTLPDGTLLYSAFNICGND